jgi:hypothetical protein
MYLSTFCIGTNQNLRQSTPIQRQAPGNVDWKEITPTNFEQLDNATGYIVIILEDAQSHTRPERRTLRAKLKEQFKNEPKIRLFAWIDSSRFPKFFNHFFPPEFFGDGVDQTYYFIAVNKKQAKVARNSTNSELGVQSWIERLLDGLIELQSMPFPTTT